MGKVHPARTGRFAAIGTAIGTLLAFTGFSATPAAAVEILGTNNPTAIKDSYIVVFKESDASAQRVDELTNRLAARHDLKVNYTYRHALRGFAGTFSERVARRLAADPAVAYVEQNGEVRITGTQTNPPSWGLDRIDQRNLPLDNRYIYPNTANNVTAYIIDTGIRTTHNDFGGRAVWGTNTVGGSNTDCHGHGTHVAGTVGGNAYGVAKQVRLIAVKVLDCAGSGSFAAVAAGVDWVTSHHTSGPAVANMSLGGSGSNTTLENAVRRSIADGIVYSIASGNSNANACNFTPARVTEAITVNASDSNDARASFSNYGSCTDIFAPGVGITSAWHTSDSATNTISGTSMAAPHVAGGAALILSGNPNLTPAQVADILFRNATLSKITNPGSGSPNRLLFVPDVPYVTSPAHPTTVCGVPVSLQIAAYGGWMPLTWSATGVPDGLWFDPSSGRITGTPTTANTYVVTVTVRDAANATGSTSFVWRVVERQDGVYACEVPAD